MMGLTKQDLDRLLDAVETWEQDAVKQEGERKMLTAMMCRDPDLRRQVEAMARDELGDPAAKIKLRKEQGVLLRAKLIGIRDSLAADEVFTNAAAQQV